ncbi:MAG: hypothetical protein HZA53_05430 [Planctomycetes bacterium]|nr:hypothetical protein [Planctomycetota bacterium]
MKFVLWVLLVFAAAFVATGCSTTHPWRTVPEPWTAKGFEGVERARLERADGWKVELAAPRWVERAEGPALAGKVVGEERDAEIALAEITRIEAQRFEGEALVANVATATLLTIVVVLVVGAIVVASLSIGFTMGA